MRRTEKVPERPGRSWKERLERFLSRFPRIRIPFRKPRAPAGAGPGAAGRRAAARSTSPGGEPSRPPVPAVESPAPLAVREPVPVLVLAEGDYESLVGEGESPSGPDPAPDAPGPVRSERPGVPAPPAPASAPAPAGQAPPAAPRRARDAFAPFSTSSISLLALDPYRAVAQWEALLPAIEAARRRLADEDARLAVRFHEISLVDFDGSNANETIEVAASSPSGNHYLNVWTAGKCFVADLIVRAAGGRFALLARSNFIELPRDSESHRYEDRRRRVLGAGSPLWRPRAIPEAAGPVMAHVAEAALASEDDSLEGAAAVPLEAPAPGAESAAPKGDRSAATTGEEVAPSALEARVRLEAGGPSSWVHGLAAPGRAASEGISSLERPAPPGEPSLEVRADLVIYGRTRPGTEVVIDGIPVPVRADGTFDLRFALPRVVEPARRPAPETRRGRGRPARRAARKDP